MFFDRPRCPDCRSRLVAKSPGAVISSREHEFTAVYGEESATDVEDEGSAADHYDFYQCLRCFSGFTAADVDSSE